MPLTDTQLEHARGVIHAYRRHAETLIRALELEWGIPRADMLGACHRRELRRRATFDAGRGHYAFHGIGIRLTRGRFSMEIEVERGVLTNRAADGSARSARTGAARGVSR